MNQDDIITIELCTLVADNYNKCSGDPMWELHTKERCMYVCDAHLALGLRICGLPALVEQHVPSHVRKGQQQG